VYELLQILNWKEKFKTTDMARYNRRLGKRVAVCVGEKMVIQGMGGGGWDMQYVTKQGGGVISFMVRERER